MKIILHVISAAILLGSAAFGQQKKRVAVLDFDYGTVQSSVAAIFGANQDIGKGITDLLVQRLVERGTFSVIERKALDKILQEQNFSNSDRADSNTAAKLGRVLGVDAIITGTITQFGRDDQNRTLGGSAIGGLAGRYGLGGVSTKNSKAVVAITTRMINTDTAEILAAVTGRGESARSGASLVGSGGSWMNAGSGVIDMGGSNFANTILGEAVNHAVASIAQQLDSKATQLPTRKVELDGMVADVSGTQLILNIGSKAGVKVGDHLEVRRKQREITDPATGKVLRRVEDKVGDVVITEVDQQSSVGRFSGGGTAKVGDAVRGGQ
ncbi:MAG: curli production assembly protein CsgG [Acidobacteriota bacterium]|nr:curli production assembly protein CsgG [Acidobacteriota bacterium]